MTNTPIVDECGRVLYAPNPRDLVTLVTPIPHLRGGLLYLGGSWDRYPLHERYDLVVTVCGRDEGSYPPVAPRLIQRTLQDAGDVDERTVLWTVRDVVETVGWGDDVLVRCYTGQNRSGLIAALAMRDLYGMTSRQAIDHLREVRSPNVLCNPAFERYLLDLDKEAA